MKVDLDQSNPGTMQRSMGAPSWLATFWHQPRKTWLRRAFFQVHLWSGIGVGLIATVVGVSGSAIVYKDSLDRIITPAFFRTAASSHRLPIDSVLATARAEHAGWSISYVTAMRSPDPEHFGPWMVYLSPPAAVGQKQLTLAYYDPANGKRLGEIGETSGVMNWLAELHFRLLGGAAGMVVNGIGAALLLLLCITGIVLWWPGRKRLGSGFKIQWRARWLRVNWDLHNVLGFWFSIPLAIEAFTGVYYCFFVPMAAAMVFLLGGSVQQWQTMSVPPRSTVTAGAASKPLEPMLQQGLRLHRDCVLRGLAVPVAPTDPLTVQLDPPHADELGQYAQVDFDRYTGQVLSDVDSRQQSLAIRLVLFIRPLHFGTFAGQWSRIAWIVVGLSPALLFFTGFIMWWRRVPSQRMKARRRHSEFSQAT